MLLDFVMINLPVPSHFLRQFIRLWLSVINRFAAANSAQFLSQVLDLVELGPRVELTADVVQGAGVDRLPRGSVNTKVRLVLAKLVPRTPGVVYVSVGCRHVFSDLALHNLVMLAARVGRLNPKRSSSWHHFWDLRKRLLRRLVLRIVSRVRSHSNSK